MAPTLLRKLFAKTSPRADHQKFPPAIRSSRSSAILVREGSDTDTDEKPSSADEKSHQRHDIKTSCVQICPHTTLSFDLMKQLVHIPYSKYSGDKIDAITTFPSVDDVSSAAGPHLCKSHSNNVSSLKADAFYQYQPGYAEGYDGLKLCVHWTMNFGDHMDIAGSVSSLQRFLDSLDIRICEHTKLCDLRIAVKLHRLCKPRRPARDPGEAKEVRLGRRIDGCKGCHTTFEIYKEEGLCHVLVKRYLGQGTSVYEKRWLAQCGEKKHRLRSFGVAALQLTRI